MNTSRVKDKERIWKKQEKNCIQEHALKTIGRFSSTYFAGQKGVAPYIQSAERKKEIPTRNTLSGKVVIKNWRWSKAFSRQAKAKWVHLH